MGRAKPVDLGVVKFRTMGEAHDYFQRMLGSYKPGDRVSAKDGLELYELLKRHPEAATKIGVGVSHFEVASHDFNSQCFWVHRTDGSFEDFSYPTCITEGRY